MPSELVGFGYAFDIVFGLAFFFVVVIVPVTVVSMVIREVLRAVWHYVRGVPPAASCDSDTSESPSRS